MIKKLIYLIVTVSLLTFSSSADTVVIQEDIPNVGDTTTVTTVTTGNTVTTDNLISQTWDDGSWEGTMFPDSSDINESIYLTGKDGKYAETTIQSQGILTEQELQQGLTSELSADIRWWNPQESTVTMTQTATNGIDTTTQSITLEDTTNHNYQFNNYSNTLIITPNSENTHGSLTARFSFDIQGNVNYNGGHAGTDIKDPELKITYDALSSTTVTTVQYCWEKTPPTCVGQDEIAEVETILDTFENDFYNDLSFEDIEYDYYEPEPILNDIVFDYDFNDDYFEEEEFDLQDDYLALDEFFFEEQYFEDDYYEEFELEEFFPETLAFEEIEYFDELPPIEDAYFEEEIYVEVFTDEAFIEEFDDMFEEMPMEEMNIEMAEEMFEEIFEEYFEEEPPMEMVEEVFEEVIEEEELPVEEVAMVEEEPKMEEPNEVEEQPSSESIIADEPQETADVAEQEESLDEEPAELAAVEGSPTEESDSIEENISNEPETSGELKVDLDIKIAALEKVIQSKISNEMQRVSITLDAVNEIVSKEMISKEADISSYFNMNAGLFDIRQLPSGNMNFFNEHINLASYNKDIYSTQPSLASTDPVARHEIELIKAKDKTLKAYLKFKELLNERNGI